MPRKHIMRLLALMLASLGLVNWTILPGHSAGRSGPSALTGKVTSLNSEERPVSTPDEESRARVSEAYGKLPLSFEVNQGQTAPQVKFLSRGSGYHLFLTSNEAVLALSRRGGLRAAERRHEVLKIKLVGANPEPQITGQDELQGKSNYLSGNDPRQWHTNIANYARVRYEGIYPGIDMVYYGNGRQLEYDFVVAAGADPAQIRLSVEGARRMRLDERGDLMLSVGASELRQHRPFVYQEVNGVKREIAGQYVLVGKRQVGFKLAEYDRSRPLVIDPVLVYSTYLGGAGIDFSNGVALDIFGNAYVTGQTSSPDFPVRTGAFQTTIGGVEDAFVTKLNSSGSALVYSTFLGGTDTDTSLSIAVDLSGEAYVTGTTVSSDFPTTAGAFQTTFSGGGDAFVAKLNSSGSALVYSTFLGGLDVDSGNSVKVRFGNAYVTGSTESADFPTTAGAAQTTFGGLTDAFVAKLNSSGSALVYSTFIGGSSADVGSGLMVRIESAYVTGSTESANFPVTAGAFQTATSGDQDAFVTKLNTAGSAFTYSTYLGGTSGDAGQSITADIFGNVYVTGTTISSDFPTTAGAFQTARGGLFDAFVTKLNSSGSALVYSTFLGGTSADSGLGIVVRDGSAYVTGSTTSSNFPVTTSTLQGTIGGGQDAFVTKLNRSGSALVFSTYHGGDDTDAGQGIAVRVGNVYVTGSVSSTNFPVTSRAFRRTNAGLTDAFISKIGGFSIWASAGENAEVNAEDEDEDGADDN